MKKRIHHHVYDDAGRVIGYVRQWNRKWCAFHCVNGHDLRCGAHADRTQAIAAILEENVRLPLAQQSEQAPVRRLH